MNTAGISSGELSPVLQRALDKFTWYITANVREGKIDPVSGRDTEIRQTVDIIPRCRKNNPILVLSLNTQISTRGFVMSVSLL